MRPLVLREIADILGLHESTVSRVTSQKYMATPRGIFELKYFFGSHVATDTGGACSATAIRALIKQLLNQRCINLANQSGVLIVDPIDNAHGPGGDEIARYDFHHRASHGCVGQCLTEGGLHFVAQLASRFQHAIQRHRIGNAYAIVVAGRMPLDRKLFVDLWTEPIDQDDLQAHAVDQRQVLHDIGQLACCNGLARYTGDQRLSAVHVDVGRNGSEPRHKGEIENGGHRLAAGAGGLWVARYCACICRVCCVGNGRGK